MCSCVYGYVCDEKTKLLDFIYIYFLVIDVLVISERAIMQEFAFILSPPSSTEYFSSSFLSEEFENQHP